MVNPVLEQFLKAGKYYLYHIDHKVLMKSLLSTKAIYGTKKD